MHTVLAELFIVKPIFPPPPFLPQVLEWVCPVQWVTRACKNSSTVATATAHCTLMYLVPMYDACLHSWSFVSNINY